MCGPPGPCTLRAHHGFSQACGWLVPLEGDEPSNGNVSGGVSLCLSKCAFKNFFYGGVVFIVLGHYFTPKLPRVLQRPVQ